MKKLADGFDDIFFDSKPNASLTHWDDDGFHNHVYEIKSIKETLENPAQLRENEVVIAGQD